MAEGSSRGLFRSLMATLDLTDSETELTLDAALMVALADGAFTTSERDALEVALMSGALADTSWAEVLERATALEDDAPLFTKTRARLCNARWPHGARERALSLAARVGTAGTPLADEQRAFFHALALELGIDEPTLHDLLPPWGFDTAPPEEVGLLRPRFCDPRQAEPINLFDALSQARGEQLRLMMFKLAGPRELASLHFETARISEVGTTVEIGALHLRIDAVVEADDQEWWVRCLATDEALYPAEREHWPELLATLQPHQRLAIVHAGPLSPADAAAIAALDPERVVVQAL